MSDNPAQIRFGTDGWRAVVGKDFTIPNVNRVAHATALWLRDSYESGSAVVIGNDPRLLGHEAAQATASIMAAHGIQVYLANNITPTPAISWATKEYGCAAGIIITASHNPPEYNGYKIKGHYGGSALPEMIEEIERRISSSDARLPDAAPYETYVEQGLITIRTVRSDYLHMLKSRIDLEAIRDAGICIVHDAMFGAGKGTLSELLGTDAVVELRSEFDPAFGGGAPEPIERNLADLPKTVLYKGCSAGIANDGDADRIGMCDENGRFIDSHRMLALLVQYLHKDLGLSGDIVKTFSTTDMLDAMGRAYGLTVHTTPIGFKYIGRYFLGTDVLIGGEESGGIAVKGHIPDRDGIYIGLLILEMMAHRRKSLSELVDGLFDEFGPYAYHRVDVHTTENAKRSALRLLKDSGGLSEIAGARVESLESLDGLKHRMHGGWLLVRSSGTEPILRIYAEATSRSKAEAYVEDAVRQLGI